MQRLRLTWGRGPDVRFISHLDLTRLWERVFRRAGLPVSYSQGFTPHARITIAAPLALGVTSQAELLDVELDRRIAPAYVARMVAAQIPAGMDLTSVEEVPLQWRPLQVAVRTADYRVTARTTEPAAEIQARVEALLGADTLPRERLRDREVRRYDLRPLVVSVRLAACSEGTATLLMTLQTDEHATGRPDEVLAALGLDQAPRWIHRTALSLGV